MGPLGVIEGVALNFCTSREEEGKKLEEAF